MRQSVRIASLCLASLAALAVAGCAVEQRASDREAQAEAAYPPTGRILNVDGRRVHVDLRGQGRDLVLLHGAGGNSRDFTFDLADRLKDRYRVISFDRPGLGWTDDLGPENDDPLAQARLLRAAGAQLGLRDPIVLGHSYGGAVAMGWALLAPEDTAAVVLLAGATYPWPGDLGPWYTFITSGLGAHLAVPLITAYAPESRVRKAVASIFAPNPVPPGYLEHVGAGLTLRRDSFLNNARQVDGLKPHLQRMAPHYRRLTMPIEIVHGARDTTVGLAYHSCRMVREPPNARLTVLPGVGHMPHHAAPEAVVAAIDRAATRAAAIAGGTTPPSPQPLAPAACAMR